tara:strand:- start:660 stop:839 length:180 start_codon:yes stop_codon:yes gene_type:complete
MSLKQKTTEILKKELIKYLYDLDGTIYHYKFLNFTYQGEQVKEIRKDIENLKNKINNLK